MKFAVLLGLLLSVMARCSDDSQTHPASQLAGSEVTAAADSIARSFGEPENSATLDVSIESWAKLPKDEREVFEGAGLIAGQGRDARFTALAKKRALSCADQGVNGYVCRSPVARETFVSLDRFRRTIAAGSVDETSYDVTVTSLPIGDLGLAFAKIGVLRCNSTSGADADVVWDGSCDRHYGDSVSLATPLNGKGDVRSHAGCPYFRELS